ncbi:MAG TPA: SUF system NifU family Fe-S cluster assembly protein [Planctomycetota bacterium]
MTGRNELYQEMILHHNKAPRNFGALEDADRKSDGHNPLCGDHLTVWLKLDGDKVADVRFEGSGCAISTASASVMTDAVKGRSTAEIEKLFRSFHALVTGQPAPDEDLDLGKLEVFSGVSEFPARVKCASLAWHTLQAALHGDAEPVSTE